MAKKQPSIETSVDNIVGNLMDGLYTTLNKRFGKSGYKPVYNLNKDDAPINVDDFISTGSTLLDLAISNRKNGGVPVGRITEIAGLEGSGKSLICGHIVANTQKKGGIAVYIDTETALSKHYFEVIGVDFDKMVYANTRAIEDILQGIEDTILEIRSKNKTIPLTIILDSYAGATAKSKQNEGYDKTGYNTDKAIIMSDRLGTISDLLGHHDVTLIITNQLRTNMNASLYDDKYQTPGGKALPFYSSVRLRLTSSSAEKGEHNGVQEILGKKVRIDVVKNRVGPPHRKASFNVLFDSGIADYQSVFEVAKQYGVLKTGGSWSNLIDEETGEILHKFQGLNGFRDEIVPNQKLYNTIKDKIADKFIMTYSETSKFDLDNLETGEIDNEEN